MKRNSILSTIITRAALLACLLSGAIGAEGQGGALFVPGPPMNRARIASYCATLPDGRAVAFGGREFDFISGAYADIYNPVTNSFTEIPMNFPHDNCYVVKLSDGRYYIMGGAMSLGVAPGYSSTEMFDPVTNTFTTSGSMDYARMIFGGAQLLNGTVLIAGAWYDVSASTYGEVYDTAGHTYTLTNAMVQPCASPLVLPANDGGAIVFGGFPTFGGNNYTRVEYYNPADNSFHAVSSEIIPSDPGWLVSGLSFHQRPYSDFKMSSGKYLMLGYSTTPVKRFGLLTFDPATKAFATITTSSPLMDAFCDGGFYDMVLDKVNNFAYLLGMDSGFDPIRASLVTVNLATGAVYHAGSTAVMPAGEYPMGTMAFLPTNGKILFTGISSTSSDYFHATDKTYIITPQPALDVPAVEDNNSVGCYPNPVSDMLKFRLGQAAASAVTITVYDLLGRTLACRQFSAGTSEVSIETGNLPSGFYLYQLGGGADARGKFMKY